MTSDEYAWQIVPGPDFREVFAASYEACAAQASHLIRQAAPSRPRRHVCEAARKEAKKVVRLGKQVEIADPAEARGFLRRAPDDSLIRTAALLERLSVIIAPKLAWLERFGNPVPFGDWHVSTAPRESFWDWQADAPHPRTQEEVSNMLGQFHPGLEVTPVKVTYPNHDPWTIARTLIPSTWRRAIEERAGSLKIAMCPLTTDEPLLRLTRPPVANGPHPFAIHELENEESQCEFLGEILDRCAREQIAILVLPELRVSPRLEGVIRGWLSGQHDADGLLLVIAGSWHVAEDGDIVNRTVALDHRGRRLWHNDKLAEFNVTADNVAKAPPHWRDRGIGPAGAVEDISVAKTLTVADTPLGRMTSAICAGFFHEYALHVMQQSGANFFFVPAMTPKMDRLEHAAQTLVYKRAGTFIANCGHHGRKAPSFWQSANGETGRAELGAPLLIWESKKS